MRNHTTRSHRLAALAIAACVALGGVGVAGEALAAPLAKDDTVEVYRLYNPWEYQHLYTVDVNEYEILQEEGWQGEGAVWLAPKSSSTKVSRLYNPFTGEHLLSVDAGEIKSLTRLGWTVEEMEHPIYSSDGNERLISRLYNPYAEQGDTPSEAHFLSVNEVEIENLVGLGWQMDGTENAIYAVALPGELDDVITPVEPEEPNGAEDPGALDDPYYAQRLEVIELAMEQVGKPYVWGGESLEEGGFDCSGLVYYVYGILGYDLPRTTYGLESYLKSTGAWKTDIEDMKLGDVLVMNYSGHVGIFAGKDPETGRYMMIDAGNEDTGVVYREIFYYYHPEWSGPLQGGGSIF